MEILIYLMSLEQFSFGDASQEFLRWDEEKLPFFSRQILKQTIILCKHIGDQLPCHIPMARITNEISTAHPLAGGICKDDIHAYKLMLLAVTVVLRDDIILYACESFSSSESSRRCLSSDRCTSPASRSEVSSMRRGRERISMQKNRVC